jgi:hypothetical protein
MTWCLQCSWCGMTWRLQCWWCGMTSACSVPSVAWLGVCSVPGVAWLVFAVFMVWHDYTICSVPDRNLDRPFSWPLARAASGASDCAFIVSQVPEVARGAAQASHRNVPGCKVIWTAKRPVFIVLHQVLW